MVRHDSGPVANGQDGHEDAGNVTPLDDGLWLIDLGFQGRRGVIAAFLLAGGDDLALIETGPATTLPRLLAGIRAAGFDPAHLTRLLVTHIHLDHAGAAGILVRQCPRASVLVHPVGAPHLVDPSRLVDSAGRIYGDRMETLWGEVVPVPQERVIPVADGEPLAIAGRVLSAVFTPGHASHHVAYWDTEAAAIFTGDVAGVRLPGTDYVCPPTPPPDLDVAAWTASMARLQGLAAERLYLTHFGPFDDAAAHLARLVPNLEAFIELAEDVQREGAGQAALAERLHARMTREVGGAGGVLDDLELATPSYMAAMGLARYLERRRA